MISIYIFLSVNFYGFWKEIIKKYILLNICVLLILGIFFLYQIMWCFRVWPLDTTALAMVHISDGNPERVEHVQRWTFFLNKFKFTTCLDLKNALIYFNQITDFKQQVRTYFWITILYKYNAAHTLFQHFHHRL